MYTGPIDLDRGVMICTLPGAKMDIFMYLDQPGVYFDCHGNPVPEGLARAAGFPVETLAKKRRMAEEMEKTKALIEAKLQIAKTSEVYAEKDGYKVVHFPETGMAVVESGAGRLTPEPVPLSLATTIFGELCGGTTLDPKRGRAAMVVEEGKTE